MTSPPPYGADGCKRAMRFTHREPLKICLPLVLRCIAVGHVFGTCKWISAGQSAYRSGPLHTHTHTGSLHNTHVSRMEKAGLRTRTHCDRGSKASVDKGEYPCHCFLERAITSQPVGRKISNNKCARLTHLSVVGTAIQVTHEHTTATGQKSTREREMKAAAATAAQHYTPQALRVGLCTGLCTDQLKGSLQIDASRGCGAP